MPTTRGTGLSIAAVAVTAAAATIALAGGCGGDEKHPNVLLISIDMLRPDHLHCYGYGQETSPHIDGIAREGALFENHFASSSWTLPSHASIFTSLPDSLHGCTDADKKLDPSAVTVAERFRSAGYATAGFFSGPYLHPAFGLDQGFDHYEDCASYAAKISGRPPSEWAMDKEVMVESHQEVSNERVYDAVTRWLAGRTTEKPFFLFVHLFDVHFDFVPPPPYDKKFDPTYASWVDGKDFLFDERYAAGMQPRDLQHLLALYDGEIAWTDSILGKLRADLEKAGLLEDTVLAITSDHGTELFEHLDKGHRKTLYDEVIRTPLIVRYPAKLPPGCRVKELSRGIDVGPTLLDLAGFPVPEDTLGMSLATLVTAPGTARIGRVVSELDSVGNRLRAVRTLKWKLLDRIGTQDHWYFDLQRDPGEQNPKVDFESELGQKATSGYEAEVDTLNAFSEKHVVPATRAGPPSAPPPDIEEKLRKLGYTGENSLPTVPPK